MADIRVEAVKATVTIREALAALDIVVPESAHQILCPVHQERNPSARIYKDSIYCFTCAKRYDVVALVQAVKKLSFPQALDWCEEVFGVKNPAEFVDDVVPAMLRHQPLRDYTREVVEIERLIKKNRCAMGLDRFNRAWLALDTAVTAHDKGTLDDEAFEAALRTLGEFAVGRS